MALSQATLDRGARHGERMDGDTKETVTWHSRTSRTGTATNHTGVIGDFEAYREGLIALHAVAAERPQVLRDDERLRVASSRVTWTPTPYDSITRDDASVWLIVSIEQHGDGYPSWIFQTRKSPPTV